VTVGGASCGVPVNATNPVQLRWNDINGPLRGEIRPDASGNFSTMATVPDAPPGSYTIVAMWLDDEGNTGAGTPTRAIFEIRVPGAAPTPAPAAASEPQAAAPVPAPTSGSSSFPVGLVLLLGVLGLVLFGGGFVAVSKTRRTQCTPARARRGEKGADLPTRRASTAQSGRVNTCRGNERGSVAPR